MGGRGGKSQKNTKKQTKTKTKTVAGYQNPEKQNSNKALRAVASTPAAWHYKSVKETQCLQIQFHVQPRTSSFHLMRPPVKSPGSLAMCISVFSEGTSKGLKSGGGSEVRRQAEGQCMGRRRPKKGWCTLGCTCWGEWLGGYRKQLWKNTEQLWAGCCGRTGFEGKHSGSSFASS